MVKTLHFHCRGHGFDPWELRSCIMFGLLKKTTKTTTNADFVLQKVTTQKVISRREKTTRTLRARGF